MKTLLSTYLAQIAKGFVYSSQAATKTAVTLAKHSDDLAIDGKVGGVPIHIDGASNLPPTIMMMKNAQLSTEAFLELDAMNRPVVTLKRGLYRNGSRIIVRMGFERSQPLESLQILRDRSIEVLKDNVQEHRVKMAISASGLNIQALERVLADMKQQVTAEQQEKDDGATDER